ncbi:MAG: hemerythrin domain-containing protein [Bacteroidales bacterium]
MYAIGKYSDSDKMSDLICNNYPMLLVMNRFGITLGFGDQSIREVCENKGVDVSTFLSVINLLSRDDGIIYNGRIKDISLTSLIDYLKKSHNYFLDFKLPLIREKLKKAGATDNNDICIAIMKYYDQYVQEVYNHMHYEEEVVFPYIKSLLEEGTNPRFNIEKFSKKHDNIDNKLTELKDIIIKYYPGDGSNNMIEVLFDIFSCAEDLSSHSIVENNLLIPAVRQIENNK